MHSSTSTASVKGKKGIEPTIFSSQKMVRLGIVSLFIVVITLCIAIPIMKRQNKDDEGINLASLGKQFQLDTSSDKYMHMSEEVAKFNRRSSIKLLHTEDEYAYEQKSMIADKFQVNISVKPNQVVAVIGPHSAHDFEIPLLSIAPSTTIFSLCSSACIQSLREEGEESYSPQWKFIAIQTEKNKEGVVTAVEDTKQAVDTIMIDTRQTEWDLVRELVARFCLVVRQYVIITKTDLQPDFANVRAMKAIFREYGYTYSHFGSDPNVRVFQKVE